MARWIDYTLAGAILLIFVTLCDHTHGYRADPESVLRHRRESETARSIEVAPPVENTNDAAKPLITQEDANDKPSKAVTRNRGKIKYQSTLQAPKTAEKVSPSSSKRATGEDEKQQLGNRVRSRPARNVSETTTTAVADVTEASIVIKEVPLTATVLSPATLKSPESNVESSKLDASNTESSTVTATVLSPVTVKSPESNEDSSKLDSSSKLEATVSNPDTVKSPESNVEESSKPDASSTQSTNSSDEASASEEDVPGFDISKYTSGDFLKGPNPYEGGDGAANDEESTFVSLQVHDPVEAFKGIRAVDATAFRFEDELTTPKTPLFDERYGKVRDEILANIAEASDKKTIDGSKLDLTELAEKAKTDNKTTVDVMTVKELHNTDAIADGHIIKEFVSANGTSIKYETSDLETNQKESDEHQGSEESATENSSIDQDKAKTTVSEEASVAVTVKTPHDNVTAFVNNLDVKVREVFPDLSTQSTKIAAQTQSTIMTVPVVDPVSNNTHPRLRISVKTNKIDYGSDSDADPAADRNSTREQKSYTPDAASAGDDSSSGKLSNIIRQSQEQPSSRSGTTKTFRQMDSANGNMNLPDNADVWSLVGLKHVPPPPPQQRRNNNVSTELPSNIKQLADWSVIMKNDQTNVSQIAMDLVTSTAESHHYPTESQGEENKLVPVQVPAPTKTPILVVDSNIPGNNDITTVKPDEVMVHTATPVRVTSDYRDTLQLNRVDDFDAGSSSSSSESSYTTPPPLSNHNEQRIPVILRAPSTTISSNDHTTTNNLHSSSSNKPYITANILEIIGPTRQSDAPASTMSAPDMEQPVTSEIEAITESSPDTETTTQVNSEFIDGSITTETSEEDTKQTTTEIPEDETEQSTEMQMYNDSPAMSTVMSQDETEATTVAEEPTTAEPPEYTTNTEEEFTATTSAVDEDASTTTEDYMTTILNETPVEVSTQSMYDLIHTSEPSLNRSSMPILASPNATVPSSTVPEAITLENIIVKTNSSESEDVNSTTAASPISVTSRTNTSPTDSHDFEDEIDEYSDNSEGNDINLNSNNLTSPSTDEGTTKTVTTMRSNEIIPTGPPDVRIHNDDGVKEVPTTVMAEDAKAAVTTTPASTEAVPPFHGPALPATETPDIITTTTSSNAATTDGGDPGDLDSHEPPEDSGAIAAVTISAVGVVALIALVALLYVMRKRQNKRTYGQRCTPVSLDAYSVDSVSVYSSVRGKNRARASKRSYGNPAYNDSCMTSHSMSFPALSNFVTDESAVFAEFADIPAVTVRADEVPPGCEVKNRYANVMPLPETRVPLAAKPGDEMGGYINANYVRGPKGIRNYYIACQAPMQSTVHDFWRMIWEQQTKVVLMITDLYENGVEKCADYLPPSEVLDCHRLFGDYKVTLKKREVKNKYVISSVQLCNMESGTWREITHLWYMWPEKGVPKEYHSMIAFLIEARSFMKSPHDNKMTDNNNTSKQSPAASTATPTKENAPSSAKDDNHHDKSDVNVYSPQQAQKSHNNSHRKNHRAPNDPSEELATSKSVGETSNSSVKTSKLSTISERSNGGGGGSVSSSTASSASSAAPVVVHCSPGTGRTGAVIACDLAIREFEFSRTVDLPRTVYRIRRDRANAVQTKEQYMFIYQVINLYATKLTGGVLDSI